METPKKTLISSKLEHPLETFFIGPPLLDGPLPAVFYFSIHGQDSLELDPFNQPVLELDLDKTRVFSITLPLHEKSPPLPTDAINNWTLSLLEGFFCHVKNLIETLIKNNIIDPNFVNLMGLSRGVFIALHVAKQIKVRNILGFSPMLALEECPSLDPFQFIDMISTTTMRFYIGNRDKKTSTKRCMDFILLAADMAYEKGVRSPPIELFVKPSIGHLGHGTSMQTFKEGAQWLNAMMQ